MSPQDRLFAAVVAITGVVGMLLFGAIQTSFPFWVDVLLYSLAAIFILAGVYLLYLSFRKQPTSDQPASKRPLFSVRMPEPQRSGHIDSYKTVWFDKVLITKRSEGDRVLRFYLSMPDREFVDVGEFQQIYQEQTGIHSAYHSNPLDLPNNAQKVLAFVLASGPEGVASTFELSIRDVRSDNLFTISTLGEHVCFDDGSVELSVDSPPSTSNSKRERIRAREDLEARLAGITSDERAAYHEVDRYAQDRGIHKSGLRSSRYVTVAEEHDLLRENAVRDWRRRLGDAGFDNLPDPPSSGVVHPSSFLDGESLFDRHWGG
jgi:hypothetical protein